MKLKLEKFKEKDKKRKFIIIFTVCCILLLAGVFLYTSFAVLTEEKQFNVINGQYQDPGDLYFAVYVDGEITNTIPSKDSGYTLDTEKSSCTNGATITWDNDAWSALVNLSNYSAGNMSRTKCTMYFKKQSFADTILACNDTAANCIKNNANLSNEIATDDPDNNARYIGADPNNYVSFNHEVWRIIGVFNSIDDGNGAKETRLKIIRDKSIGNYNWDYTPDRRDNGFNYANDWTTSTLMTLLNNGAYYNRTTGNYYNNSTTAISVDFSTTGLTSDAKSMIGNAVWNLGAIEDNSHTSTVFYTAERGTTVYSGRPTEWIGQIGLMYPSDYGYATGGGNTTSRNSCLNISLDEWEKYSDCYNNNWLYDTLNDQWTLTPRSADSFRVFNVFNVGSVFMPSADHRVAVFPTIYLSSNVKITGGTGTSTDPYQLSL